MHEQPKHSVIETSQSHNITSAQSGVQIRYFCIICDLLLILLVLANIHVYVRKMLKHYSFIYENISPILFALYIHMIRVLVYN